MSPIFADATFYQNVVNAKLTRPKSGGVSFSFPPSSGGKPEHGNTPEDEKIYRDIDSFYYKQQFASLAKILKTSGHNQQGDVDIDKDKTKASITVSYDEKTNLYTMHVSDEGLFQKAKAQAEKTLHWIEQGPPHHANPMERALKQAADPHYQPAVKNTGLPVTPVMPPDTSKVPPRN